jgi:glyoxylase-like metal-dependent hydrolase (beta-lactamase superfamily II)
MLVDEVVPGVWRAGTRYVNWYVVDAGAAGLTVVDGGLPGYRSQLEATLRRIGRQPEDVRGQVLTHGHLDHIGIAPALAGYGAQVYLHPADVRLAEQPRTNKTDRPLWPYLRYPGTLAFLGHAIAQGGLRPIAMPDTKPISDGDELALPGRPERAPHRLSLERRREHG